MNVDLTSNAAAEEILRLIYGEDFTGCTVRLEDVASIVREAIANEPPETHHLLEIYEKAIEAVHLLSTPPAAVGEGTAQAELLSLLSGRLDTIHTLTNKLRDTSALIRPNIET